MAKQIERMNEIDKLLVVSGNLASALNATSDKLDQFESRLVVVEKGMTCDSRKQEAILSRAKKHVTFILGGSNSPAYFSDYRKTISRLWGDYRHFFGVVSYRDTPVVDYDRAIAWIDAWRPSQLMGLEEPTSH